MTETEKRWNFSLSQLLVVTTFAGLFFGLIAWQGSVGFTLWLVLLITWKLLRGDERTHLRVLKVLAAYGVLSIVTLPLKSEWWIGEFPVFLSPQAPKAAVASEVRRAMVRHVMRPMGLSQGSASPDSTFARPYALAVVYVVPLAVWLAMIARRTRLKPPHRYWAIAVVVLALADYVMTLKWAGGPGLSIY